MNIEIAIVGLGKMGLGINNRLSKKGIKVYGYDSGWNEDLYKKNKINGANNLKDLIGLFNSSRKIIWVMVPSGKATDDTITELNTLLNEGDVIIDGGNSNYKESIKKYNLLKSNKISFLDSGTSGEYGEKKMDIVLWLVEIRMYIKFVNLYLKHFLQKAKVTVTWVKVDPVTL